MKVKVFTQTLDVNEYPVKKVIVSRPDLVRIIADGIKRTYNSPLLVVVKEEEE